MPSLVGSDFTRRRGGQKRFLSLSVRHACERQSLCARFRHEGVVKYRNDFDAIRIGEGLWLCTPVQLSQIAANWRHHKIPMSKKRQNLGFFASRGQQNKPIQTKFGT